MRKSHLKSIRLSFAVGDFPTSEKMKMDIRDFRDCIIPLHSFVDNELHRQRHFLESNIRDVTVMFMDSPTTEFVIASSSEHRALEIYVDVNSYNFLEVDPRKEVFGPFCIKLLRDALKKIRNIDEINDFPFVTIEDGIKAFEKSGFCYKFKAGERTIPGTKLKGAMRVELTSENILRKFIISYRGKQLSEHVITGRNRDYGPGAFPDFTLDGYTLHCAEFMIPDLAAIDLSECGKVVEIIDRFQDG